jgi:hypothetical protein
LRLLSNTRGSVTGVLKVIRERFHQGRQLAAGSAEAGMALDRYLPPQRKALCDRENARETLP